MTFDYTEDNLVQKTTAEYLEQSLGWDSIYAYNTETFGPNGSLGRESDREVILRKYLLPKLQELNPNLPESVYQDAIRQITEKSTSQSTLTTNREKYELLKAGIPVRYRTAKGELKKEKLRIINFNEPEKNHFLCVRELWVRYRRRADIVGFVNGIPLLFMECKNVHKDIRQAYDHNLKDYINDAVIPHLFYHNAFIVLGNGIKAKVGSITSKFEYFGDWKRLAEEEPGVVDMQMLLKGLCDKHTFMDMFENFIVFDDSSGRTVKILARNHQYLGVNRAIQSVQERHIREGKLGVFWHTQGAGKSYSMVFFSRKIHRKIGGNYTFIICTDRDDLDTQIYKTFAGCGLVDNDRDPCRTSSGDHLKRLLKEHKSYVFTLIQKFNKDVDEENGYSERDDIIVVSDEAHRTQYGRLALNMRNALPKASYIGFTGTPLFKDDEITRRVFGEYVSTYDFQRAVEDNATVPLYYDARGEKLGIATNELNEKVAAKLEEIEIDDINVEQRLERELKREYHIITAEKRLEQIARDFVVHYSNAWESGKAMLICIDKLTCVRMYNLIYNYWQKRIHDLEKALKKASDSQEAVYLKRQINWMQETQMAVVVSEEQGEVDKFKDWNLDITVHRKRLKNGFEIPSYLREKPQFTGMQRLDPDSAFKEPEHPFRIAIVCAMWLTGFDVPTLSTLYLDKPLKAHTLMQAIARANRVSEGKNNGLVVDYCGILKDLRQALATFAGQEDDGRNGKGGQRTDPTRPKEELLNELKEAIILVTSFLEERGVLLDDIINQDGFERNAAIEVANENDETRKRFEIMCRQVFKKFKACINLKGINAYRKTYDAVNIIYRSLQNDRDNANIDSIIRELHKLVDEAITVAVPGRIAEDDDRIYDISKIDFARLAEEFDQSAKRNTVVQNLKTVIEKRLQCMLEQNPLRTDFQKHYEEIIKAYNSEKDRPTIENTFEQLIRFVKDLDAEDFRAIEEGLDQENLVLFDLLKKPGLSPKHIKQIKKIGGELLALLKREKLKIDHWRDKEATRDAVRLTILDFLYNDRTGLPVDSYTEDEVERVAQDVFQHVFRVYPILPSPYYESFAS